MNVQKIWMAVLRRVQTQLEATLVPVTQAIDWQAIDVDVMVTNANYKRTTILNVIQLYIHSDIDECHENTDACDHLCSNNNGSYTCSCRSGYRLASDGVTCNGMKLHNFDSLLNI